LIGDSIVYLCNLVVQNDSTDSTVCMSNIQTMSDELNLADWTSGNKKVDDFIREKQSKIYALHGKNAVFEWIPYDQFNYIKKVGEGGFATVYSAIWKDGPLKYDVDKKMYTKVSNKKVALKWLNDSQNVTDKFLNEVWKFFHNEI